MLQSLRRRALPVAVACAISFVTVAVHACEAEARATGGIAANSTTASPAVAAVCASASPTLGAATGFLGDAPCHPLVDRVSGRAAEAEDGFQIYVFENSDVPATGAFIAGVVSPMTGVIVADARPFELLPQSASAQAAGTRPTCVA